MSEAAVVSSDVVVVRRARPDEYPAIDRLIEGAYEHDYGPSDHSDEMHSAQVRDRRYDVWVAIAADVEGTEGGPILGSVTTRRAGEPPLHEDFLPNELDLRLLGVAPEARRRGVAAALMNHVAAHARSQGFDTVALKTAPNMTGAHKLYEALGYRRDSSRDGLWIGGKRVFDLFAYLLPLE